MNLGTIINNDIDIYKSEDLINGGGNLYIRDGGLYVKDTSDLNTTNVNTTDGPFTISGLNKLDVNISGSLNSSIELTSQKNSFFTCTQEQISISATDNLNGKVNLLANGSGNSIYILADNPSGRIYLNSTSSNSDSIKIESSGGIVINSMDIINGVSISNQSNSTTSIGIDSTNTTVINGDIILSDLQINSITATDINKKLISLSTTGSGNVVLDNSPTLVTPNIGVATATSLTLNDLVVNTNATFNNLLGFKIVATNGSKELFSAENTGGGNVVLSNSPTLVTPILGDAQGTSLVLSDDIVSLVCNGDLYMGEVNYPGERLFQITNRDNGTDTFVMMRLENDTTDDFVIFLNSSNRVVDGGTNAVTIRNETQTGTGGINIYGGRSNVGVSISQAGTCRFNRTTESTSITTGGATFAGGVGISKSVFIGLSVNIGGLTANQIVGTDASKNLTSITTTGTGSVVLTNTPSIINPLFTNYLDITSITSPGNPSINNIRFYVDSSDSTFKSKNNTGIITVYQPNTTKGDILTHDGTVQTRLPVGTDNQILISESTSTNGIKWVNFEKAIIQDKRSSNVNGDNSTANTWVTRILNFNSSTPGISISSNIITLSLKGTYIIDIICSCYNLGINQIRLYDVTNSVVLAYGISNDHTGSTITHLTNLKHILTISTSTQIKIEHYSNSTTTNGFGKAINIGGDEVYLTCSIIQC